MGNDRLPGAPSHRRERDEKDSDTDGLSRRDFLGSTTAGLAAGTLAGSGLV